MQQMRELTVQGGNGTLSTSDRTAITTELQALGLAVTDAQAVAAVARINYQAPPGSRMVTYQIGADFGQTMTFDFNPLAATLTTFLAGVATMNVSTSANAATARTTIDTGLSGVVTSLTKLGGFINALEHQLNNVRNQEEMQARARSQIVDVDMAEELADYARSQIMQQGAFMAARIHNLRYGALAKLIYAA
jgi:flagellin